jgi:hypothetical protein
MNAIDSGRNTIWISGNLKKRVIGAGEENFEEWDDYLAWKFAEDRKETLG